MGTRLPGFSVVPVLTLVLAAASAPASLALPFDSTAVEIVQFTDYQCPFCGKVEPTLDELERSYGPALRIVVRHQPLSFHQHARGAAEAAEAARNQGRFDDMHARLFANQQALTRADLVAHAVAIGLDVRRFERDLDSPEIKDRVERDGEIANAVGATGTPAFFINGKNLRGAQPLEKFKALIDEELGAATRANRRGDAWLSDRLSANNADLWGYLRGGQLPSKAPKVEPPVADTTIYKVTIDANVDASDGPGDALITLVEFTEYQCPFCKKLEPTIDALMTRYAGKIRRIVKHTPLPFHKDARPAAAAAICAQAQGRFWQMHDSLFVDSALDPASLRNRASALGLDLTKFERCLAAPSTEARIKADIALAGDVTARGTPNTFINGRKITGSKAIEEFTAVIDQELARAQVVLAAGVKAKALYAELIKDGKTFSVLERDAFSFADSAQTPILGNPRAKVRITVFSDLQCPFCSRVHEPLQEVVRLYKGKVALAWKHFPLSFHKEAMPAARATMCAHEQKKFWEATADLFAGQKDLAQAIPTLPERIGLDHVRYASCMNQNLHLPAINADMEIARNANVRGTPTIFIQGRHFSSPSGYNVEAFSEVIDALLAGKEP